MIDGISNNDRYYGDTVLNSPGVVGVPATLVPTDAIGDFTVQQTPSAEFGVKGGAAINVVMKSGGNIPHGTGYYFRHDDWTDSPNFFVKRQGGDTTPVKNAQYGGTFGGPLQKDKTFIFGYYEGQRLAVTSPYVVHVPTAGQISQARARIAAAGLQPSPVGENLLKFYPTDPSATSISMPNISNMNTFSVKLDHQLNPGNLINERVFWGQLPVGAGGQQRWDHPRTDRSTCSARWAIPIAARGRGVELDAVEPHAARARFRFNLFSQTLEPNRRRSKDLGINCRASCGRPRRSA
jgi:hypothetical protein